MAISHRYATCFLCFAFTFFLIPLVAVQITSAQQSKDRSGTSQSTPGFESQFWNYLLSNNYKHWSPVPGKTTDLSPVEISSNHISHGPLLKTYMNRTAASNPKSPPVGSVIIMENYRTDKSLKSISVMYKSEGFNPIANDWYWVDYNPDGSVSKTAESDSSKDDAVAIDDNNVQQTFASSKTSPTATTRLMGRAESCIQCHQQSGNDDLVFFNDRQDDSPVLVAELPEE